MISFKKQTRILVSIFLNFTALLFSASLHAESEKERLSQSSVNNVECTTLGCFFPGVSLGNKDVIVSGDIEWNKNKSLILHTKGNIIFEKSARLTVKKNGSLTLKVGMEPGDNPSKLGELIFNTSGPQIFIDGEGVVKIYCHPTKGREKHKYLNPKYNIYRNHISFMEKDSLTLYMLVNNVYDLQNIGANLSRNYALSQNIDASITKNWNEGKGFDPLKDDSKNMPFSGDFDGNGFVIENLYINRPNNKKVGLFGISSGFENRRNTIENLTLRGFNITGDHYVGALAGWATYTRVFNVHLADFSVNSKDIAGGFIGSMYKVQFYSSIFLNQHEKLEAGKYKGYVAGSSNDCNVMILFMLAGLEDDAEETPHDKFNKASILSNEEYLDIGEKNSTEIYDFVGPESVSFTDHYSKLHRLIS